MLHTETVQGTTFTLLKELMNDPVLKDFNLAGGTALALYLGHRISIDLDLFSPYPFSASELEKHLKESYNFHPSYLHGNTLKGSINNVIVDCITHQYPFLKDPAVIDGVRLYNMEDIIAMKLSAISDNGSRIKDFVDIACLSTKYPLNEMLKMYENKFNNSSIMPLKGLSYYNDILFQEPVNMINTNLDWKLIENRLQEMITFPGKIFNELPINRSIINDFTTAALKSDFGKINAMKDGGFVLTSGIINELSKAGIHQNTIIALQKIYGMQLDPDEIKLANEKKIEVDKSEKK